MKQLNGNVSAELQVNSGKTRNEIGEVVPVWTTAYTLLGWLDLSSGDAKRTVYSSKIQESTHVFLCDYVPLDGVTPENCRLVIKGKTYDVTVIDNVMELDQQLEIYLKFRGE